MRLGDYTCMNKTLMFYKFEESYGLNQCSNPSEHASDIYLPIKNLKFIGKK